MASPTHTQNMVTLAQQARTVLAGGRTALLTLPCEQARGWVGVIDDGGEPVLMASTEGRLACAARNGRRSWVEVPGHAGERLILAGTGYHGTDPAPARRSGPRSQHGGRHRRWPFRVGARRRRCGALPTHHRHGLRSTPMDLRHGRPAHRPGHLCVRRTRPDQRLRPGTHRASQRGTCGSDAPTRPTR